MVSIHAPVWGANLLQTPTTYALTFQSTHPCGVRTFFWVLANCADSFNPRTRVGCENQPQTKPTASEVSIHAPVWGANTCKNVRLFRKSFNPRTRVGCEPPCVSTWRRLMFQSTHPCGVRRAMSYWQGEQIGFNPRTRVGCEVCLMLTAIA